MSMQRTAQSALYALEELYRVLDSTNQQHGKMTIDDSENLVHALCTLSQLIHHINQTGICGHTPMINSNIGSNRFSRQNVKTFTDYDKSMMMDSATIGAIPQPGQPYGECVLYHPIRIITTCADDPIALHENNFSRKEGRYRKTQEHSKQLSHHHNHRKKSSGKASRSNRDRSKSVSQASRSGSRETRMSRGSRRSNRRRSSSRQSRARTSRSSRSSKSGHRRSHSRSRSSRKRSRSSRRSRSSQRRSRSRRRSSQRRRSANQENRQYRSRQIPSHPSSTPTAPFYPLSSMGPTPSGAQQSMQQPHVRTLPSPTPIATTNSGIILPPPSFSPVIPLPPPPPVSTLHHHQPSFPLNNIPPSSFVHGNQTPVYRSVTNPLNDHSSSYQQVPTVTTQSSLPSINPMLTIPPQNGVVPSGSTPLQTTNSTLTSRSENCPECRAITRLLQWSPLKCYDAAGIRRGIFLAGPKSEQLLDALYSSMKDLSLSFDDIGDCICDNE